MEQDTHSYLLDKNLPLSVLLGRADERELCRLANLITDNGKGRLMLDKNLKELIISFQGQKKLHELSDTLAKEICAFGSNSAMSIIKNGEGDKYHDILKSVAKILGCNTKKTTDFYSLERSILSSLIYKAIKGKSNDELFVELKCDNSESTSLIAESILNTSMDNREHLIETILDTFDIELLTKLVNQILTEKYILMLCTGIGPTSKVTTALGLAARFNPLTAVVSVAAGAYSLSGPAFRVVIPAVVQIALIRYHQIAQETHQFCTELESCL
ncbi:hypothetical protein H3N34_09670 [Photobacterium damselae subsp. damselae]|uniref:hypothetical protein n=1 Tax=Photobacterium damselae TaxID=38293 RepID=UPI0015F77328|nr:hypothetical protein [Photobacterium damselae]MBA5683476.1 hypothetical protein [Photobacterium damselae subsp. damselae]